VHSGSFAPAFTLSFHDSECSRKPPNAHSLGRQSAQKPLFLPSNTFLNNLPEISVYSLDFFSLFACLFEIKCLPLYS